MPNIDNIVVDFYVIWDSSSTGYHRKDFRGTGKDVIKWARESKPKDTVEITIWRKSPVHAIYHSEEL